MTLGIYFCSLIAHCCGIEVPCYDLWSSAVAQGTSSIANQPFALNQSSDLEIQFLSLEADFSDFGVEYCGPVFYSVTSGSSCGIWDPVS